jgi:hypothetical protein
MSSRTSGDGLRGVAVYALFLLGTVVVGPLEAVLGAALYWLFSSEDGASTADRS